MRLLPALFFFVLPASGQQRARTALSAARVSGTVERFDKVPPKFVAERAVDVWLPPGYAAERSRRYPVLYV